MIETQNLCKYFTKRKQGSSILSRLTFKSRETVKAVDNISLHIKKGEIFGLIGPNGAGKTTFVKLLSTLILPDTGVATINGHNVVKEDAVVRSQIGVLPGEFSRSLYWRLTGRQNLKFFAELYNIRDDTRIDYLIEFFGLKPWEDELLMRYSTGMKHKLALARALLNDPPVLLLDEPTTGIDPKASYEIKNLVKEEFSNKTVLWTSHNLYEIEEICDRIAMINKGQIVFLGSPEDIKREGIEHEKITLVVESGESHWFSSMEDAKIANEYLVEITSHNITDTLKEILDIVKDHQITIKDLKTTAPTLEEVFMKKIRQEA
ncbi:MAG: ABC transporter ATP-binding protein [Candidatus Methanofastidiosia archaeon]|jgi:ABC-2 type transport system ATP-binding protein